MSVAVWRIAWNGFVHALMAIMRCVWMDSAVIIASRISSKGSKIKPNTMVVSAKTVNAKIHIVNVSRMGRNVILWFACALNARIDSKYTT